MYTISSKLLLRPNFLPKSSAKPLPPPCCHRTVLLSSSYWKLRRNSQFNAFCCWLFRNSLYFFTICQCALGILESGMHNLNSVLGYELFWQGQCFHKCSSAGQEKIVFSASILKYDTFHSHQEQIRDMELRHQMLFLHFNFFSISVQQRQLQDWSSWHFQFFRRFCGFAGPRLQRWKNVMISQIYLCYFFVGCANFLVCARAN